MNTSLWQSIPARLLLALLMLAVGQGPLRAANTRVRIKDITSIEGDRINQLKGMGLVTGLAGTGGKTPLTRTVLMHFLQRNGIRYTEQLRETLRNDTRDRTDNLSVVSVIADLPPGRREGETIDVIVSTIDDAESLQGGVLLYTPLTAVTGEVYAVAQGPLTVGGFSFSGDAATVQKNHPTTGRITNGATIELETCSDVGRNGRVGLLLRHPGYETARRITVAINEVFPDVATQVSASIVDLQIPLDYQLDPNGFIGRVGEIHVTPDVPAVVVINERTGTVIIGENVKLSQVLIAHANLAIMTSENQIASQPLPFAPRGADAELLDRTQLEVVEEEHPLTIIPEQATVGDLAQALNALGVTPRDLSSIFQMLKESGNLHAELQIK